MGDDGVSSVFLLVTSPANAPEGFATEAHRCPFIG